MSMHSVRLAALAVLVSACRLWAQEPRLSEEQMKDFLLNAKVVDHKQIGKGITSPHKLTLNDGTITHDAGFQSVNESLARKEFRDGKVEVNFVDSYKYNIAAYELAKLVGLGDMMPVTVERKWDGKTGSLSWWLPVKMDEEKRLKEKITPPDALGWNKQMFKMRVFAQLVYDTDRNLGNVLIGEDWKLYMIDFSRAFRLYDDLLSPQNLTNCDKNLLEQMRKLDVNEVTAKTKPFLRNPEIKALMKRRDKIVALFDKLIAEKGEAQVLY
jgi:hypothetical protein